MSDYFDRVERQIVRRVQDGVPRTPRVRIASGHLAVAAAVLVVILVAGVFLLARGSTSRVPVAPASAGGMAIAFEPSPAPNGATIARTVRILQARLAAAVPAARVSVTGGQIVIRDPSRAPSVRAEILALTAPGQLAFYDWEANALTPNGESVASRLAAQDPAAFEISQGSGGAPPGTVGAGCVTLHQALALAVSLGASAPRRAEYVGPVKLAVPAGFVVLRATGSTSRDPGYFVLKDRRALPASEITKPEPSQDPNTGVADVTFGFTAAGRRSFESVTATLARRGSELSGLGQTLNQHFAIALDNQLIAVPYIDYKQYPDGISGENGAEVSGSFTKRTARQTAILLRYGPLPVNLTAAG